MHKILYTIGAIVLIMIGYMIPPIYTNYTLKRDVNTILTDERFNQNEFEIVLVYIGNSTCPASNIEGLDFSLKMIKDKLALQGKSKGYGVKFIGVSTGSHYENELRHLSKFGSFDEIIIGNGWSNLGVLKYFYDDFRGLAATPQLIISLRRFDKIDGSTRVSNRGVIGERIIFRKLGAGEIEELGKSKRHVIPEQIFISQNIFE